MWGWLLCAGASGPHCRMDGPQLAVHRICLGQSSENIVSKDSSAPNIENLHQKLLAPVALKAFCCADYITTQSLAFQINCGA